MALRRLFARWLMPAAFVLPAWLLVGWAVFNAGGWAFLWVLFIAVPSVFLGQLLLAIMVRSRPSVRASGAVSWLDVAGFSVWHVLTIAVGFYPRSWFGVLLGAAILVGIALIASTLRQLWREAKGAVIDPLTGAASPAWEGVPPQPNGSTTIPDGAGPVIVVKENPQKTD